MPPGRQRRPVPPVRPTVGGGAPPQRGSAGGSNADRAEDLRRRQGGANGGLGARVAPVAIASMLGMAGPAGAQTGPASDLVRPDAPQGQGAPAAVSSPGASLDGAGPPAPGHESAPGPAAPTTDAPAWAQAPHIPGTLRAGATGPGVEALQRALGLSVTGTYDAETQAAVAAYQAENGLVVDGEAGGGTLGSLGLRDELRSASHSPDRFIPTYRATAYSESDLYRTKEDPYAVGAITRPEQEDDDGGKTYGTYQFESYVYRDGSKKSDDAVDGSTVMRFVRWKDNPYGARLAEAAKDGVATDTFDAAWKDLTARENKAFGKAQERFLEVDVAEKVTAFFDAAKVPANLRKDLDLYDVAIGTVNQYGSLVNGMAVELAARIAAMQSPTADQVGAALQDIKSGKVESHFKRSPKAWGGIRARIDREKRMFE